MNSAATGLVRRPAFISLSLAMALTAGVVLVYGQSRAASSDSQEDIIVASRLAEMLRSARSVISQHQDVINDPSKQAKGLTPDKVLEETVAIYKDRTGNDPARTDPKSREGRLIRAQMAAIHDVIAENQDTINQPGVAFKGFIPAVFGRLVSEKFSERVGEEARMKVTAPEALIRNRRARPDGWEKTVLTTKFTAEWPREQAFTETASADGRQAFRFLAPEYYTTSCLSCHGEPAGEMDITGYPKEGGKKGDLGAAISVTLFK